jgi:hypothetical protein
MIPAAYVLKRKVAEYWPRFWNGEKLRTMAAAPIYYFSDHARFNSDDVEILAKRLIFAPLRLPHDAVLFEVIDPHPAFKSALAFCIQIEHQLEAYLVVACRDANRFTDVLAHACFRGDGFADVEINPFLPNQPTTLKYAEVLTALVWRGLAILSQAPTMSDEKVPLTRRPKLVRAGVTGFTWHLVDINPDRMRAAVQSTGGTHASPRWHIRRGHWRTLSNGRRVFVRVCEIGDPSKGAVFKDYRVTMGEAA